MQSKIDNLKKDIVLGTCGVLILCLFVFITNPSSLPAPMLLVVPALLGLVSFVITRLFISTFLNLTDRRIKLISSTVAVAFVLIFSLGSVGQLGFQDVILAISLIGGLGFYFSRFAQD